MECTNCDNCECRSDILDTLTDKQRGLLESKTKTVTYRKGEILCKQGAFASKILFLKKGLVKTYLESSGKDVIFCIKPSGSFVGLESLYNKREYPYSCTVYEDSDFCMFESDMFQQMIEQNGRFASKILEITNMWIGRVYERIITLTQKQVTGKLADVLICLSERVYLSLEFEVSISRKDLSDVTQLSPETLSRALKDFKNEGVIDVDGKFFKILDMAKLKRYSEIG